MAAVDGTRPTAGRSGDRPNCPPGCELKEPDGLEGLQGGQCGGSVESEPLGGFPGCQQQCGYGEVFDAQELLRLFDGTRITTTWVAPRWGALAYAVGDGPAREIRTDAALSLGFCTARSRFAASRRVPRPMTSDDAR